METALVISFRRHYLSVNCLLFLRFRPCVFSRRSSEISLRLRFCDHKPFANLLMRPPDFSSIRDLTDSRSFDDRLPSSSFRTHADCPAIVLCTLFPRPCLTLLVLILVHTGGGKLHSFASFSLSFEFASLLSETCRTSFFHPFSFAPSMCMSLEIARISPDQVHSGRLNIT